MLPGGTALVPLTRPATPNDIAVGVDGLLGLLQEAASTFQRPDDGVRNELRTLARWLAGLRYQARHPESRVDGEPRPGWRPVLRKLRADTGTMFQRPDTSDQRADRALLEQHRKIALAADRLHRRNQRAAARGATVHDSGPRPPAADDAAMTASLAAQAQAHAALQEARDVALARASAGGIPLHRRDALVQNTDETQRSGPGADPPRDEVLAHLARVRAELQRVRRNLGGSPTPDVVDAALLTLEEHARIDEDAWATMTWRTTGGWRRMRRAQEAAAEVRCKLAGATIPSPAATGDVIPVAGGHGEVELSNGPVPGMARTVRGRGHPANQDAATVGRTKDGSGWLSAVADGLSAGERSERAALAAVKAARAVFAEHRAGDDPAQTVRRAYQAAAEAVAAIDPVGMPNPAQTTLVVALVVPSSTTPGRFEVHVAWGRRLPRLLGCLAQAMPNP